VAPTWSMGPDGAAQPLPLLEVRDYRVHFPIRRGALLGAHRFVKAVDGVSFPLQAGRTRALVGESGCGKTTTGKAIVQLLRGSARISGSVMLDGQDLGALQGAALRAARREIQIIFQDPYASLNPRMRVAEILEEGVLSLRPEISVGERRRKIAELVATVGLHAEAMVRTRRAGTPWPIARRALSWETQTKRFVQRAARFTRAICRRVMV
jgi:peptide/nickel transport system ATP-binding protein